MKPNFGVSVESKPRPLFMHRYSYMLYFDNFFLKIFVRFGTEAVGNSSETRPRTGLLPLPLLFLLTPCSCVEPGGGGGIKLAHYIQYPTLQCICFCGLGVDFNWSRLFSLKALVCQSVSFLFVAVTSFVPPSLATPPPFLLYTYRKFSINPPPPR